MDIEEYEGFLEQTHCLLRAGHSVLLGKDTMSAVAMTHGLLGKRQSVLCDIDTILWFLLRNNYEGVPFQLVLTAAM